MKKFQLFFIPEKDMFSIYLINNTIEEYGVTLKAGGNFFDGKMCIKGKPLIKSYKLSSNGYLLLNPSDKIDSLGLRIPVTLTLKGNINYEIFFKLPEQVPKGELVKIRGIDNKGIELNYTN